MHSVFRSLTQETKSLEVQNLPELRMLYSESGDVAGSESGNTAGKSLPVK